MVIAASGFSLVVASLAYPVALVCRLLVVEHGSRALECWFMWLMGLAAPWHVGSCHSRHQASILLGRITGSPGKP